MKERKADLFDCMMEKDIDGICITTNSNFLLDGRAAMSGECAKQCADRYPETAVRLGKCLRNLGNNVPFVIGAINNDGKYIEPNLKMIKEKKFKCLIFSFPTANNAGDGGNLELINNSAKELKILVDRFELRNVALCRVGCGAGKLEWADVKPVLEKVLDDKYTVVSFPRKEQI